MHLLVRDYRILEANVYKEKLFAEYGLNSSSKYHQLWEVDLEKINSWRMGKTGCDFVDTQMR